MSPKAMQYKANSIIFFKKDISDKIFILKSGQVSLNYTDIETGQEIHDLIKPGEFFGVRSALGRYARDQTAQVLTDSVAVAFTVPEFEQLALQNTRIIIKMLRIYSNMLRRIHKQVQNLIFSEEQIRPEEGLYRIGEYYLKNKRYSQALYVYQRYLTYYPSGRYASDVNQKVQLAEQYLQKYGQGKGPSVVPGEEGAAQAVPKPEEKRQTQEMSGVAKQFYNAVSLLSQQKYQEALVQFRKIVAENQDAEYTAKSQYEMGRSLFYLKQHDASIQAFTSMIQKYPNHPDLREALYYVGNCYAEKGDTEKAKGFYNKILSLTGDEDAVSRKVKKALRDLGGGGQ